MSKLETVRALNDSEPNLHIVAAVRTLQQTIQQLTDDLNRLPETISMEVEPLVGMKQRVEEICQAQRAAISAVVEQISGETIKKLAGPATQISNSAEIIDRLPDLLTALEEREKSSLKAQARREQAIGKVTTTTVDRIRRILPRWWEVISYLLLLGIISGSVAGMGSPVFEYLVPASADRLDAQSYRTLYQKATREQWEAIQVILK